MNSYVTLNRMKILYDDAEIYVTDRTRDGKFLLMLGIQRTEDGIDGIGIEMNE